MSLNELTYSLPENLRSAVEATIEDWRKAERVQKIWAKDAAVWTNDDEAKWLGWLDIVERQLVDKQKFADFQTAVKAGDFSHILLLGMGGSSLCPEVLSFTFGKQRRLSRFAYSRLDRSGTGSCGRGEN